MVSRLFLCFRLDNCQGAAIRRQSPVEELEKIICDAKYLFPFTFEWIKGEEGERPFTNDAVDAGCVWDPCTLMITDPVRN